MIGKRAKVAATATVHRMPSSIRPFSMRKATCAPALVPETLTMRTPRACSTSTTPTAQQTLKPPPDTTRSISCGSVCAKCFRAAAAVASQRPHVCCVLAARHPLSKVGDGIAVVAVVTEREIGERAQRQRADHGARGRGAKQKTAECRRYPDTSDFSRPCLTSAGRVLAARHGC